MATILVEHRANVTRTILEEVNQLPIPERLAIIESLLRGIREELRQTGQVTGRAERKRRLAQAAAVLLTDYMADTELTAFTALDGEDFYAEG